MNSDLDSDQMLFLYVKFFHLMFIKVTGDLSSEKFGDEKKYFIESSSLIKVTHALVLKLRRQEKEYGCQIDKDLLRCAILEFLIDYFRVEIVREETCLFYKTEIIEGVICEELSCMLA